MKPPRYDEYLKRQPEQVRNMLRAMREVLVLIRQDGGS